MQKNVNDFSPLSVSLLGIYNLVVGDFIYDDVLLGFKRPQSIFFMCVLIQCNKFTGTYQRFL